MCADVPRTVLAEHEWLVSETVLGELERALAGKIGLPERGVRSIVRFVHERATVVGPADSPPPVAVRDPDDTAILSEALESSAAALVTGDKDLLELVTVGELRILSPRGVWERVTATRRE